MLVLEKKTPKQTKFYHHQQQNPQRETKRRGCILASGNLTVAAAQAPHISFIAASFLSSLVTVSIFLYRGSIELNLNTLNLVHFFSVNLTLLMAPLRKRLSTYF